MSSGGCGSEHCCQQNPNPVLKNKSTCKSEENNTPDETIAEDTQEIEVFNNKNVFDLIRHIIDPEHPVTLEDLNVVQEELIDVSDEKNYVKINFTPTIPYCSMATLIGLSIRVQLLRCLPPRFKVTVEVTPGTHNAEKAINKQLADKERVAAALENTHLISVINDCIPRKKG
ncbi:MIP18 family protein galla-2 [Coccinella septempunctata]|uniref:MIP18 family protein galla-2 n=1 Tax=Coccinella septempunctata TaxID=41139 RepID=UPI001D094F4B|nr:MIP18 family protein galla-2 [Coccinella septempunctata]